MWDFNHQGSDESGSSNDNGAGPVHTNFFRDPETRKRIAPMTPQQFITGALLPELVLKLIQQDLQRSGNAGATMEEAEATREASVKYGNAMFPDKDDGDDHHNAQDGDTTANAPPSSAPNGSGGRGKGKAKGKAEQASPPKSTQGSSSRGVRSTQSKTLAKLDACVKEDGRKTAAPRVSNGHLDDSDSD